MKILHLSTFDTSGGAARAVYRLHQGLRNIDVDSQILVRAKSSKDKTVIAPKTNFGKIVGRFRANLNALPLRFYELDDRNKFSAQWFPENIASQVAAINPDIINLHWIANGYLQIDTISKFNKPLVWTLHDMWAFTGGCFYAGDCERYIIGCGSCPLLKSTKEIDLSRRVWQWKVKAWRNLPLTIISPTKWLAKCALNSSLFQDLRVEVIPHGLDTKIYKPLDKNFARNILNLPQDKQLILFGSIEATKDYRKGFHLLQPALRKLAQSELKDKIELVVFGSSKPEKPIDLGFNARYLGRLNDDITLALAYCAADVMIVPSTQEAFGQTASESLACGTPVIGFDDTGVADIVEHQQTGYLAKPYEIEDLAKGIAWVLENKERHRKLCLRGREKAEQEFTLELQAKRYLSLYTNILKDFSRKSF